MNEIVNLKSDDIIMMYTQYENVAIEKDEKLA